MSKFCRNCGNPLPDGVRFCPECGEPVMPMQQQDQQKLQQESPHAEAHSDGQFTRSGGVLIPEEFAKKNDEKARPSENKPKKKGKGWIAVVAVLLIAATVAILVFRPFAAKNSEGIEVYEPVGGTKWEEMTDEELDALFDIPTGASTLAFSSDAYKTKAERVSVDNNNKKAKTESGVKVTFDDYCLTDEARELQVRSLGKISDENYEAVGYDLTLNGESAKFYGLAKVTLPYDKSWGEDVFVQYKNEKTGAWEIIYAKPDGKGHVTFSTEHFCTFAVFRDMVKSGKGKSSDSLFTEYNAGGEELRSMIKINWAALAALVREGKLNMDTQLKDLTTKGDAYFAKHANTLISHSVTGMEYLSKLAQYAQFAEKLGSLGKLLTVGTFLYQGYSDGWSKAIDDNGTDLVMLGVGIGGTVTGPVGWVCSGISLGYFIYKAGSDGLQYVRDGGQDSIAEYAYREFTSKYMMINKKTGQTGTYYHWDQDARDNYMNSKGYNRKGWQYLTYNDKTDKNNNAWADLIGYAMAREDAGKGSAAAYIEEVIDSYCNYFWENKSTSKNIYQFMKNTDAPLSGKLIDGYKQPSKEKQKEYTQNLKNDIYKMLRPQMEIIFNQDYQKYLNSIYSHFLRLEQMMNEMYYIELKDPKAEYFSQSEYSKHPIGLAVSADEKPFFTNSWHRAQTCKLEFTYLSWLKYGCPSVLKILGSKSDKWNYDKVFYVKELDLKPGNNVITLGDPISEPTPSPENDSFEEFLGTWTMPTEPYLVMTIKEDEITIPIHMGGAIEDVNTYKMITYKITGCSVKNGEVTLTVTDPDGKAGTVRFHRDNYPAGGVKEAILLGFDPTGRFVNRNYVRW